MRRGRQRKRNGNRRTREERNPTMLSLTRDARERGKGGKPAASAKSKRKCTKGKEAGRRKKERMRLSRLGPSPKVDTMWEKNENKRSELKHV